MPKLTESPVRFGKKGHLGKESTSTHQKLKQIEQNFRRTHQMMESITKINAGSSPMGKREAEEESLESPSPALSPRK